MTANDIRELNVRLQESAQRTGTIGAHNGAFISAALSIFAELAAQVAESNEHLKRIANPLMDVHVSPWVELNAWGQPVVIDRNEVSCVLGIVAHDTKEPRCCVVTLKSGTNHTVVGSVVEICAKLRIAAGYQEEGGHGNDPGTKQTNR